MADEKRRALKYDANGKIKVDKDGNPIKGAILKENEHQRPNGTFEYKYRDKEGGRHSIYAKTLEELREKEDTIQRDILNGKRPEKKNITINEVYNIWVDNKRNLKDNTFQNYKYSYTQYVEEGFGRRKIQSVKFSDVKAFYNSLLDGRNLSISTVDSVHTVLHQVFQTAVRDEYIYSNPSDGALTELKRAHNHETKKRRALTKAQQDIFEEFLSKPGQYQRWLPIFTVMLWTGMRVGEICGLRWRDIDLINDVIVVNHTLVYYDRGKNAKCGFAVNTPKTDAGKRIIPMLPKVKEAFLMEKAYQEEIGIKSIAEIDGYSGFVFVNRFGNTQHQGTLNKALRRIIRDCNYEILDKNKSEDVITLPPFSNHSLRHTFATRLCEANVNIKAIQDILGHADIQTTMDIYAEATKDLKTGAMIKLEQFFEANSEEQAKELSLRPFYDQLTTSYKR